MCGDWNSDLVYCGGEPSWYSRPIPDTYEQFASPPKDKNVQVSFADKAPFMVCLFSD